MGGTLVVGWGEGVGALNVGHGWMRAGALSVGQVEGVGAPSVGSSVKGAWRDGWVGVGKNGCYLGCLGTGTAGRLVRREVGRADHDPTLIQLHPTPSLLPHSPLPLPSQPLLPLPPSPHPTPII